MAPSRDRRRDRGDRRGRRALHPGAAGPLRVGLLPVLRVRGDLAELRARVPPRRARLRAGRRAGVAPARARGGSPAPGPHQRVRHHRRGGAGRGSRARAAGRAPAGAGARPRARAGRRRAGRAQRRVADAPAARLRVRRGLALGARPRAAPARAPDPGFRALPAASDGARLLGPHRGGGACLGETGGGRALRRPSGLDRAGGGRPPGRPRLVRAHAARLPRVLLRQVSRLAPALRRARDGGGDGPLVGARREGAGADCAARPAPAARLGRAPNPARPPGPGASRRARLGGLHRVPGGAGRSGARDRLARPALRVLRSPRRRGARRAPRARGLPARGGRRSHRRGDGGGARLRRAAARLLRADGAVRKLRDLGQPEPAPDLGRRRGRAGEAARGGDPPRRSAAGSLAPRAGGRRSPPRGLHRLGGAGGLLHLRREPAGADHWARGGAVPAPRPTGGAQRRGLRAARAASSRRARAAARLTPGGRPRPPEVDPAFSNSSARASRERPRRGPPTRVPGNGLPSDARPPARGSIRAGPPRTVTRDHPCPRSSAIPCSP